MMLLATFFHHRSISRTGSLSELRPQSITKYLSYIEKNHPTQSKAVQCLYNKEIQLQRAFILTLIASKSSE